jgi:multidrug efflux pump subunit AcrA (membrane-fusion protein)
MFARATVPAGPDQQVVAVPDDAIVERDGITYIAVVMPGQRGGMMGMLMAVTVGSDVADWVAITSGNVQPGMPVITRGTERMLPFPSPVQIVDERGTPIANPAGGPPRGSREGT